MAGKTPPAPETPPPPEPAALLAASRFRDRLGGLLVGGFLTAMLVLFWVPIPESNEQLLTYMIGQLSGFAAGVVAYHYTMNALNERAAGNTGAAFRAVEAAAAAGTANGGVEPKKAAAEGADQAAEAAAAEAEALRAEAERAENRGKGD